MATFTINLGDDWQTKINAGAAGDTFQVAAGTHRNQSCNPKANQIFVGMGANKTSIMSGSKILLSASFAVSGSFWRISGQTQSPRARNGLCQMTPDYPADHPACSKCEELFRDHIRVENVENFADLSVGKWWFDYTNDFIYVADNPAGHLLETSITETAFNPTADGVSISNLTIEEYSSPAQYGAINAENTSGWSVFDCKIWLNHGGAFRVGFRTYCYRNEVSYNGEIGIVGVGDYIRCTNNHIHHNDDAFFDQGWEGGGTKFVSTNQLVVSNNYSHNNTGPGIWADIDNINSVYEFNVCEDNSRNGIYHEISEAAVVRYNRCNRNGFEFSNWVFGGGITISASPNCQVYQNIVLDNADGITGAQQSRGSGVYGPHEISNLSVHDNVVRMLTNATPGWIGLAVDFGGVGPGYYTTKNNGFDRNRYYWDADNHFTWGDQGDKSYAFWTAVTGNPTTGGGQDQNASSLSAYAAYTPAALQVLGQDTFTGTIGSSLVNHVSETAHAWGYVTGGGSGNWILSNVGTVYPGSAGTGHDTVFLAVPASNEYDVSADFVPFTHSGDFADSPRLLGRWVQTAQTGYMVYNTGGTWTLYKFEAGTATALLGTYVAAFTDGTPVHVLMQIRNAAITIFINGTSRITSASPNLSQVGYGGIGSGFMATAASNTTGVHMRNFFVTGVAAGEVTSNDLSWAPVSIMLAGKRRMAVPSGFTP